MRIFSFQPVVGSAEGDVWGQLPPSGVLRLFEQAAVAAAADAGFDGEFHRAQGTAWVIRRLTFLMHSPAHLGDRLQLSTWLSHAARVRAYREYRLENLAEPGTPLVAAGIAEWVYIDREKVTPRHIPKEIEDDFDMPGAPVGNYEPPSVEPLDHPVEIRTERVAEWYECDSMGHVNNAVYVDWLDFGPQSRYGRYGLACGRPEDSKPAIARRIFCAGLQAPGPARRPTDHHDPHRRIERAPLPRPSIHQKRR